ncbi:PREDICTED: uncharacterized protein LOC109220011 [Nicotiana attenuata]|uniref:uncharacterized protein LOC109220011 n=1 Tax=Nicotiana attenuata TaxID=49451 RepID=UPI000905380A|nr:PREDICTED: uncharacterized protein LOC109220011 [Nicotiana attenuata]
MTEIPLWVKFPKLPMSCWGCGSLGRIASALGKPLFANECMTKQTRISYARMLIEVNVSKPLPDTVVVMEPNGKKFQQEVVFEWKPQFCPQCLTIGHICTKQPEQQGRQMQNRRRDTQQTIQVAITQHKDGMNKLQQQDKGPRSKVTTHVEGPKNASKDKEQMPSPELNLINFPQLSAVMLSNVNNGNTGATQREIQRMRQVEPPEPGGPITAQ